MAGGQVGGHRFRTGRWQAWELQEFPPAHFLIPGAPGAPVGALRFTYPKAALVPIVGDSGLPLTGRLTNVKIR